MAIKHVCWIILLIYNYIKTKLLNSLDYYILYLIKFNKNLFLFRKIHEMLYKNLTIRDSLTVRIGVCRMPDRGSIPRRGV